MDMAIYMEQLRKPASHETRLRCVDESIQQVVKARKWGPRLVKFCSKASLHQILIGHHKQRASRCFVCFNYVYYHYVCVICFCVCL